MRVCVAGAGCFIGGHLCQRLKADGHTVVGVDWKRHEYFDQEKICDTFHELDLRSLENCLTATAGCEWVFNLAADMGGMGFIQSNNSVILYNNTMISFNVMEAVRRNDVKRLLYTSSACVYPEHIQESADNPGLKEADAWPAAPQDAYGMEKLYAEEMVMQYGRDFGIETRIARLHNIYGPFGTWKDGREKAPAAFCRKAICAVDEISMWGDGEQTRSFCLVDDCVEGLMRLMCSDHSEPLNVGSEEMVSMNELQSLALSFRGDQEGGDAPIRVKHTEGPEGVRGRNSDNTRIREVLGWEPTTALKDGLKVTYDWIAEQVEADRTAGIDVSTYCASQVVTQTTESLDSIVLGAGGAAGAEAVAVDAAAKDAKPVAVPAAAAAAGN
jgi:GDP-D-mannose 3',5'-epimerase